MPKPKSFIIDVSELSTEDQLKLLSFLYRFAEKELPSNVMLDCQIVNKNKLIQQ